jgi:DNA-binding Lrp family transcriptional regulator
VTATRRAAGVSRVAVANGAGRPVDTPHELRPAPGLSPTDEAIVQLLQGDGRAPISEIARKVGLATKAASRRVDHLIAAGVIDVTAVTTPDVLGYQAGALLGVRVLPGAQVARIVEALWRDQRIDYMSVVGGPYRLIVEVFGRDTAELRAAIERDLSQIPGIGYVELFPYLSLYYQRFRFDPNNSDDSAVSASFGANRSRELDFMDKKIVAELNLDGRCKFQSLGDQLGVSESQVRRRVKRMVDSGSLRIMAMANPRSLGYGSLAWLAVNVAGAESVRSVAERLAQVAGVIYIIITSGRYDLFVDVVARDHDDLLRLLDEEVRTVPGVQYVQTWLHLDLHWRPLRPALAIQSADGP